MVEGTAVEFKNVTFLDAIQNKGVCAATASINSAGVEGITQESAGVVLIGKCVGCDITLIATAKIQGINHGDVFVEVFEIDAKPVGVFRINIDVNIPCAASVKQAFRCFELILEVHIEAALIQVEGGAAKINNFASGGLCGGNCRRDPARQGEFHSPEVEFRCVVVFEIAQKVLVVVDFQRTILKDFLLGCVA